MSSRLSGELTPRLPAPTKDGLSDRQPGVHVVRFAYVDTVAFLLAHRTFRHSRDHPDFMRSSNSITYGAPGGWGRPNTAGNKVHKNYFTPLTCEFE